ATYDSGATPILTAAAENGSTFEGWSGPCAGAPNTCQVTMNAAKTVTGTFNLPRFTLTVNATAGTGSGAVTSNDGLINCSAGSCTATYDSGATPILTA